MCHCSQLREEKLQEEKTSEDLIHKFILDDVDVGKRKMEEQQKKDESVVLKGNQDCVSKLMLLLPAHISIFSFFGFSGFLDWYRSYVLFLYYLWLISSQYNQKWGIWGSLTLLQERALFSKLFFLLYMSANSSLIDFSFLNDSRIPRMKNHSRASKRIGQLLFPRPVPTPLLSFQGKMLRLHLMSFRDGLPTRFKHTWDALMQMVVPIQNKWFFLDF